MLSVVTNERIAVREVSTSKRRESTRTDVQKNTQEHTAKP